MTHLVGAREYNNYWLDSDTDRVVIGRSDDHDPCAPINKFMRTFILAHRGIPRELVDTFLQLVRRAFVFYSRSS